MSRLHDYIAETLQELHNRNKIDFMKEADAIMEKILDPDYSPPAVKSPKNKTKIDSYNEFSERYKHKSYHSIYDVINATEFPVSRADIAVFSGLRLSSVCARVCEMMEQGVIRVSGRKVDPISKKYVETLETTLGDRGKELDLKID